MIDQADKLRQLVRETVCGNPTLEPALPLVVVSGAQADVGTSTVAARVAEELVHLGKRIVLVDANLVRPALATILQIETRQGIGDVLNGNRSAIEVLEPIADDFSLLPAVMPEKMFPETDMRALRRLIGELRKLRQYAELIVLDAGFGMSPWVERMWTAAMQILLVTTTSISSVRDAYSAVKMAPSDVDGKLRLVVNRCDNAAQVTRVGNGFSSTCRQYLGMQLVGNVSQIACETSKEFRSSVRLLAADVLSHTYAFSDRVPRVQPANTARSQAMALLTRQS